MNIGKIHKLVFGTGDQKEEKLKATIKTRLLILECFLVANDQKSSDQAPDYRLVEIIKDSDEVEIGAAWTKRSQKTGEEYLSLSIDDPSFDKRLNAYAFKQGEGHWDIVWSRPKPSVPET